MRHGVDEVALYAILLREAGANRHVSALSLLDDLSSCPGELSLAAFFAYDHFTELDWQVAKMLHDNPERVIEVARALCDNDEPLLAEELLHAGGPYGKRSSAQWAAPFRERWRLVRKAIRAFESEGITAKFDDLNQLADNIYCAAAGATREELLERFYDPFWETEVSADGV